MAGAEGSRRGCTAGSVEAATAVTGEGSAMEASSAKRKAVAEAVAGHPPPPLKERAAVQKAEEEDAGAGYAATAVAAPDNAGGKKPPRPENRMSMREIRWVLNRKRVPGPGKSEELKEIDPSLIEHKLDFEANDYYRTPETFPKLQAWIRRELETKGYVEMDDDWVRRRREANAILQEALKKAEALLLSETSAEEDDDDESDYDDDDDEF